MEKILKDLREFIQSNYIGCKDAVIRVAFEDNSRCVIEYDSDEFRKVMIYGRDMCAVNPEFKNYEAFELFYRGISVEKACELFDDAMPAYRNIRYVISWRH